MSIRVITTNNIRAIRKNSENKKSAWIKAKEGHVMVSVDASFNPINLTCGTGAVIRDDHG
jgi:hypothetical protein